MKKLQKSLNRIGSKSQMAYLYENTKINAKMAQNRVEGVT